MLGSLCSPALLSLALVAAVRIQGPSPADAAGEDALLVLTHATLFDGIGGDGREDVSLVLQDGRILRIVDGEPPDLPASARVADLGGRAVVPGLFDTHVHLATSPSSPNFREDVEGQLRTLLGHGVTDVRDMAGDGRVLAYLARQTHLGELVGPDISFAAVLAGPARFRDPRVLAASRGVTVGQASWAHEVTPQTDLAALMQRVRGIGARGVKLYSDLSPTLVAQTVEAAHAAELEVWSHWVIQPGQTTAFDAVRAGVDVVSHAFMPMFDAAPAQRTTSIDVLEGAGGLALLEAMRERGTVLDATLIAATAVPGRPGWVEPGACSFDLVRIAREVGVAVSTGSDHPGDGTLPAVHLEYALLEREAGFTPLDVLEAATRVSAIATGVDDTRGTLEPGKDATFLVLDDDPTSSTAALAAPLVVVKRGVIYEAANLRDAEASATPLDAFPELAPRED